MKNSPFHAISTGANINLAWRAPALGRAGGVRELRSAGTAGCASMCCVWQNRAAVPASPELQGQIWAVTEPVVNPGAPKTEMLQLVGGGGGRRAWQDFSLLSVLVRTKSFHSPVVFSSVRLGFLIQKSSPDLSVLLGNAGSSVRHSLGCELHAKKIWLLPSEGLILQLWRSL